ncbi:unnamed protein product [Cladocopium goreaui]|uniref:Uncharacterized protein n=1 Tax=Cladocopium goreaui TaxID=2562237 RepID=A0A9P1DJ44_9DINO|nr:unnamed protein product [Cladocopium goreaui]
MWADIQYADALLIRDGGQEAPFNATHFNTAMDADRVERKAYKCGQNWWRHNLTWSACPGAAQLYFLLGFQLHTSKYQCFLVRSLDMQSNAHFLMACAC